MGKDESYISIVAVLNHPFSRGSVYIKSSVPTDDLTIDPKYFSHPLDLEPYGRYTQWLETLAATEFMASLLKRDGRRIHSDKPVHDLDTAKSIVKETFISHYHLTSTCLMLPGKLGGVVNNRLLVYGIPNLRVVDASMFLIIPRGNI
jgi:choline dehydrogenase-like flavoprotein